jgi:hypothetical protein
MAKIYSSGNYVIVDDGDNLYEYAKGHTLYVLSDDIFYIKEITQGQYKVSVDDLDAGNITAEDSGDVYNVATFTTFLRENTGFKTAPGGSGATPVGATLMKTGQTTSHRTGDDGDLEAGRATSFFVLPSNNPFGNTNRFTDELGGQTYTNNIVIDWSTYNGATVLGYRRTDNGVNINWNDSIDGALSVSIGTFTSGWRLPNVNELNNIILYSSTNSLNYAPLNISTAINLWTSTTNPVTTSIAYILLLNGVRIQTATKGVTTNSGFPCRYVPVRTFTVTGTTLT